MLAEKLKREREFNSLNLNPLLEFSFFCKIEKKILIFFPPGLISSSVQQNSLFYLLYFFFLYLTDRLFYPLWLNVHLNLRWRNIELSTLKLLSCPKWCDVCTKAGFPWQWLLYRGKKDTSQGLIWTRSVSVRVKGNLHKTAMRSAAL